MHDQKANQKDICSRGRTGAGVTSKRRINDQQKKRLRYARQRRTKANLEKRYGTKSQDHNVLHKGKEGIMERRQQKRGKEFQKKKGKKGIFSKQARKPRVKEKRKFKRKEKKQIVKKDEKHQSRSSP